MSTNNSSTTGSDGQGQHVAGSARTSGFSIGKVVKYWLLFCLVADVIWATLVAKFGGSVIHLVGGAAHAGHGATTATAGAGSIVIFIVALFQGAIFEFIGTVLLVFIGGIVFFFIGSGKRSSR